MKYRKRVFAMDECELRAALSLLMPDRDFAEASRQSMQEELVQWLLSEGLSARHEFLLYREDSPPNEEVWLLSRRTKGCPCCGDRTLPLQSGAASPSSVSPCPSPSRGRSPSPRPSAPSYNRTPAEGRPAGDGTKIQSGVILGPTRGRKVYDSANGGASRMVASTAVTVSRVGGPRTAGPVSSRVAITEQPKPGQKTGGGRETQKKKSLGEECCVECGHFCVDVISSLK